MNSFLASQTVADYKFLTFFDANFDEFIDKVINFKTGSSAIIFDFEIFFDI